MKKSHFLLIFFSLISINLFATDQIKWSGDLKAKFKTIGSEGRMNLECSGSGYYENENAWVDAKVKVCHNDACNNNPSAKITLERCLVGYEFVHDIDAREFIELGRDRMDSLFESKIQYDSHFNGLHLGFQRGDLLIHGGPQVLESKGNHYGGIVELVYSGLPVILTHSITQWATYHDYTITQTSAKYRVMHVSMKPVMAYVGILRNLRYRGSNNGAYFGVTIGDAKQKGNFLVDANVQYTCENAIPCFDYAGIGTGASLQMKGIYAVTDRFSVQTKLGFARQMHTEVSAIYCW